MLHLRLVGNSMSLGRIDHQLELFIGLLETWIGVMRTIGSSRTTSNNPIFPKAINGLALITIRSFIEREIQVIVKIRLS